MRAKFFPIAASFSTFLRVGPAITESSGPKGNADERLVGVQVIYRHGARTPVYSIPCSTNMLPKAEWSSEMTADVDHTVVPVSLVDLDGNPVTNERSHVAKYVGETVLPGGSISGQLTTQGQKDLFKLGERLRQRYITELGFVSAKFDPQQVYSRSTRYPRNVASTRCLLAGMFGTQTDGLKIHLSSIEDEAMMPNRWGCPFVADSHAKMVVTDFPPGMLKAREEALQLFGPGALTCNKKMPDGSTVTTESRLHAVRDELICRIYHGFAVPEKVHQYAMKLNTICPLEMVESESGPHQQWESVGFHASAGRFCQLLLDNLSDQVESKSTKFRLFATHDNMLITILLVLDLFDGEWPNFGADIIIELYEGSAGEHKVRILYYGKVIAEKSLKELQQQLKKFAKTAEQHKEYCRISR